MRYLILFAALASVSVPAYGGTTREVVVRKECHGDRCVLYDRFGRRIGTVTVSNGRAKVRDEKGRLQATVRGKQVRVEDRR